MATLDGQPVRTGDDLHCDLISAIDAARSERSALSLSSCRRVPFEIEAEIRCAADHRPGDVEDGVRLLLLESFSYSTSHFGQRVAASDLLRLVNRVAGVISLRILRFHRAGMEHTVEAYLEAAPACWDEERGAVSAAELLELRPEALVLRTAAR